MALLIIELAPCTGSYFLPTFFRIQFNRSLLLIPPSGLPETCAQVYVLDTAMQVANRKGLSWGAQLREDLLTELADMFFVRAFLLATGIWV